jgi:hypothetical protein
MLRSSEAADAAFVAVLASWNGISIQYRPSVGAAVAWPGAMAVPAKHAPVWLRVQSLAMKSATRLVLRPKQELLLRLHRDHGSMMPAELWAAIGVSRQGAMDLLNPLLEAGLVERVGTRKTGRYTLRQP